MAAKSAKLIIRYRASRLVGVQFWHIVLVGRNGKDMWTSETFPTKAHAERARKATVRVFAEGVECPPYEG